MCNLVLPRRRIELLLLLFLLMLKQETARHYTAMLRGEGEETLFDSDEKEKKKKRAATFSFSGCRSNQLSL